MQQESCLQQSNILEYLDSTSMFKHYGVEKVSDIHDIAGMGAMVVTSESKERDFMTKDSSLFKEGVDFFITSLLISLYVAMFILYKKSFSKLFHSLSFVDSVERINDIMDVNTQAFLKRGSWLLSLSISYFLAKILRQILYVESVNIFYDGGLFLMFLTVFIVIGLLRKFVIYTIKYISQNDVFFEYIDIFRKSFFSIVSVIITPIILVVLYNADFKSITVQLILLVIFCLIYLIYVIYSFAFFYKQKISFLEYILYLCSAEIIPASSIFIFLYRKLII